MATSELLSPPAISCSSSSTPKSSNSPDPSKSPNNPKPSIEGPITMQCSATWICRGFAAVARDSAFDVIAVAYGNKKFKNPLELQLHSFAKGSELFAKLRKEGICDGPIIFESPHRKALGMIQDCLGLKPCPEDNKEDCYIFEEEEDGDDDDDNGYDIDVEEKCVTLIGDEVMTKLPESVNDLIEEKKLIRGLSAAKGASTASETEDIQAAGVGASQGGQQK